MFGYVKADLSKLNDEKTEQYRRVYCTLCESLKKHYGVFSRFLLNYDITFLALLKLNEANQSEQQCMHYCPYKFKKCAMLAGQEEVFFYCASVLIILAYEKILDNIRDEGFFKKLLYRLLRFIFHRKYRKAKRSYPDLCDKIRQNMILQAHYEAQLASLDKAAHPTADSLGLIFSEGDKESPLYYFGYMLGRWIYFIDAADDLEKDKKSGSFNPFFSGIEEHRITQILNLSIGEAANAYVRIEKGQYSPIIENIIYEGTNTAQERILKGATN